MRALILVLALAGCATTPPPAIETRTVEVPVLRVEKCVAPTDIPRRPAALPKRPSTISAAVDVLLAKVREWELYGDRADPVLKGCAAGSDAK